VRSIACGSFSSLRYLRLWQRFVGEEVDAELEVRAVEAGRERRELAFAGDGAPTSSVDGLILAAAVEVHGGDAAVGQDGEADEGFALLVEGWTGFFRDERVPVALDVLKDAANIRAKVDALGVGEDFGAGSHAAASAGLSTGVTGAAVVAGCALGGLADGIAGGLVRIAKVWPSWDGLRGFDESLLGWLLGRLGLWGWRQRSRLLCRRRLRDGGCGSWRRGSGGSWWSGFAHRLQLLQHLLVDHWPRRRRLWGVGGCFG
jgi:hypothetical protein